MTSATVTLRVFDANTIGRQPLIGCTPIPINSGAICIVRGCNPDNPLIKESKMIYVWSTNYVWSDYFPEYSERMQAMAEDLEYSFEIADTLSLVEKE